MPDTRQGQVRYEQAQYLGGHLSCGALSVLWLRLVLKRYHNPGSRGSWIPYHCRLNVKGSVDSVQATQVPIGMTLVKVLLVWCMYGDVTELEPRVLQAAASPPHSGSAQWYQQPQHPHPQPPLRQRHQEGGEMGERRCQHPPAKEPQVTTCNFRSNTGPRPDFPGCPAFAVGNGYVQGVSRRGRVDWRVEGDQLFFSLQSL